MCRKNVPLTWCKDEKTANCFLPIQHYLSLLTWVNLLWINYLINSLISQSTQFLRGSSLLASPSYIAQCGLMHLKGQILDLNLIRIFIMIWDANDPFSPEFWNGLNIGLYQWSIFIVGQDSVECSQQRCLFSEVF